MAKLKPQDVEKQIEDTRGNISTMARRLGVSRKAIYEFIAKRPSLGQALQDAREAMIDNAESVLYKKVLEGSTPELLFFLKTQGRGRGYTERQEIQVTTWQDEIVQLLRDGRIKPEDVVAGWPSLADELFARAGIHAHGDS